MDLDFNPTWNDLVASNNNEISPNGRHNNRNQRIQFLYGGISYVVEQPYRK